jgi:hypothetical protein
LWFLSHGWRPLPRRTYSPDQTDATRKLLEDRADVDGFAASEFAGQHSIFGKINFTRDLDGMTPYLDPTKPIGNDHIKQAAKQTNVPINNIDETIDSMSAHLGWDITKGSAG